MKNRNIDPVDDWATPAYFYEPLNKEFSFDFDPCPLRHNINEWDWLEIERGTNNFVNPPYNLKGKVAFVRKAIAESKKWKLCVCLIPVSTSTKLFHEDILPENPEIRFIFKRIRFEGYNTKWEFVKTKTGMHDSMLVIFDWRL